MTALAFRVFMFLLASLELAVAVLLWRDSSWLYRPSWLYRDRLNVWGWARGTRWERPIALATAALAILGAATIIFLALTVPQ